MNYNRYIDIDYKHNRGAHKHHRFPALLITLLLFCSVAAIGAVVVSSGAGKTATAPTEISTTSSTESIPLTLATLTDSSATNPSITPVTIVSQITVTDEEQDTSEPTSVTENLSELPVASTTEPRRETITVQSGDTLGSIFSRLNIYAELHPILALNLSQKDFKSIYPGQKLHFLFQEHELIGIDVEKNVNQHLEVRKLNGKYVVENIVRPLEKRTQVATGTINDSLFLTGQRAGMSDALIMELAGIFGWDIDFALDIRAGDEFTVLYEEEYLDGEKVRNGKIIAAEFINRGDQYRAIEYTDSSGKSDYYDPSGKSMRKPFLRTPVDFARISSGFNLNRKHPILNTIRAHRGVDYAASTGTPIKASGDGKIAFRGTKGGYGRTIVIRHGNTYSTLYAHMSNYARNTGVGARVRQGQIIGYVGKSGLATGPHLHYEFRVNGVHRNPLTVKLPAAQPLAQSEMHRFKSSTHEVLAQLDTYSTLQLASSTAE